MGRRGSSGLVGNSPRRGKLWLQTNSERALLALFQLARQRQLALFSVWEPILVSGCGAPAFTSWFSTTFLKMVVDLMTSGMPQVCKLLFGVSEGMLPVNHPVPIILMAVNYCGLQPARRLGWAAPAYHRKERATLHPGACKHTLQYDGWPDGRFGVWVGT